LIKVSAASRTGRSGVGLDEERRDIVGLKAAKRTTEVDLEAKLISKNLKGIRRSVGNGRVLFSREDGKDLKKERSRGLRDVWTLEGDQNIKLGRRGVAWNVDD